MPRVERGLSKPMVRITDDPGNRVALTLTETQITVICDTRMSTGLRASFRAAVLESRDGRTLMLRPNDAWAIRDHLQDRFIAECVDVEGNVNEMGLRIEELIDVFYDELTRQDGGLDSVGPD